MKSLYVDSSAVIKLYVEEGFTEECKKIIGEYRDIYLSQIGVTETLINLRKRLSTREFATAVKLFEADIATFNIIVFDRKLSYSAVDISESTNLSTLDAIHIASALKIRDIGIDFLTYDSVQRKAAKSLGLRTP